MTLIRFLDAYDQFTELSLSPILQRLGIQKAAVFTDTIASCQGQSYGYKED